MTNHIDNTRMFLSIEPGSVASKAPLTPEDNLRVKHDGKQYTAYLKEFAGGPSFHSDSQYIGLVRPARGSFLPNNCTFKVVASTSGDGTVIPLVAVQRVATNSGNIANTPVVAVQHAATNSGNMAKATVVASKRATVKRAKVAPAKRLCVYCGGPLVSIGHARKGGKHHADWSTRTSHKKCWVQAMKKARSMYY
jgi:hypothetical protein